MGTLDLAKHMAALEQRGCYAYNLFGFLLKVGHTLRAHFSVTAGKNDSCPIKKKKTVLGDAKINTFILADDDDKMMTKKLYKPLPTVLISDALSIYLSILSIFLFLHALFLKTNHITALLLSQRASRLC